MFNCYIATGILAGHYDADFRRRHRLYLSVLKQFGFGQRLMESRIQVEVSELVKQVRLTDGRPFDPQTVITRCVFNVISSIIFGHRYDYDSSALDELIHRTHECIASIVPELNWCPLLRFVPVFRRKLVAHVDSATFRSEKTLEEVSALFCITVK